jgi:hypothetical protein
MRDVFYKTSHLSKKKLHALFVESHALAEKVYVDEKDSSYKRIPSEKTFEDVMPLLDKKCHTVFCERHVYPDEETPHLQVAFCTMGMEVPGDYFLWLHLSLEHLSHFVKKYKLEVL